jgi:outer membrane protein OmpA-like peptidoglycan-associated protein
VIAFAVVAAVSSAPRTAAADTTQLGLFFGPRIFSDKSNLGYVDNVPDHEQLDGAIEFGFRAARPFFAWLVPEVELGMASTKASSPMTTAFADVFWMMPRIQVRIELMPHRQLQPFLVVGGGADIDFSANRKVYDTGLIGDGYVGAGVRFDTTKGVTLRLDARLDFIPSLDNSVALEADFGIGLEFHVGEHHAAAKEIIKPPTDTDGDGIPDAQDKCPDRAEDKDGFEDADGCPDIDNDNDRVLDIADKCPMVPETYNGYEDQDGCPDTIPADVDALRGTVEGLIYADGETGVGDTAMEPLKKIAATMARHRGIRVVLMGYTDDREAKQFAPGGAAKAPVDMTDLNADLSHARADAVRIELEKLGVGSGRIDVEGHGAEDPVGENDTPRGRLANRRVEIKLFVPSAR